MDDREGLAAALRARLAAAGLEVPAADADRMERDLALHLERMATLAAPPTSARRTAVHRPAAPAR